MIGAAFRNHQGELRGDELRTKAGTSCAECYFRQAGLCALPGDAPCPTFRLATRGSLTPPRQPRLVPRALGGLSSAAG
jgi:hypothetical protein